MREGIWDYVSLNLPDAYFPKGRSDAEVLSAFEHMSYDTGGAFVPNFNGERLCSNCRHHSGQVSLNTGSVQYFTQTWNEIYPSNLPKVLESILYESIDNQIGVPHPCLQCGCPTLVNGSFSMPDFLLVNVGIVDGLNKQTPAIVVPEDTCVYGTQYHLTSAIQTTPGHFMAICEYGQGYAVLDDMGQPLWFPTFAGASRRDIAEMSRNQSLPTFLPDQSKSAIHVLVYTKTGSVSIENLSFYPVFHSSDPVRVPDQIYNQAPAVIDLDLTPSVQGQEPSAFSTPSRTSTEVNFGLNGESEPPFNPKLHSTPKLDDALMLSAGKTDSGDLSPIVSCTSSTDTITSPVSYDAAVLSESASPSHSSEAPCTDGVNTPKRQKKRKAPKSICDEQPSKKCSKSPSHIDRSDIGVSMEGEVEVSLFISICSQQVECAVYDSQLYFSFKTILAMLGKTAEVGRQGYVGIDRVLTKHNVDLKKAFLKKSRQRLWIHKPALVAILRHSAFRNKHVCQMLDTEINRLNVAKVRASAPAKSFASPEAVSSNHIVPSLPQFGSVDLDEISVEYKIVEGRIFFDTDHIVTVLQLNKQRKKEGFKFIDQKLLKNGLNPKDCFEYNGTKRPFISLQAVHVLIESIWGGKDGFNTSLISSLNHKLSQLQRSNVGTENDPTSGGSASAKDMRDRLITLCKENKSEFLNALVVMISSSKDTESQVSIQSDDLVLILSKSCEKSKHGKSTVDQAVKTMYKTLYPVTSEDLINARENHHGRRLIQSMKKLVPGILPSEHDEFQTQRKQKDEFLSVLNPFRTATGWFINPSRLFDVLQFRYPFLPKDIHVRIQGDARQIGNRHNTYIGMSIVNNEMLLHGLSYQNPKEVYPVGLFYESDSRDNLEENLNVGSSNILDDFISQEPMHSDITKHVYLGGDHMFVQAILDGSNKLGPLTDSGWNFYHESNRCQMSETAENGLRTDLNLPIDRTHPESLLPSIPLSKIVPCILHGLPRCVEKLMMLEVELIVSQSRKNTEASNSMRTEDLVGNLVTNVNARGVRNGNFAITFDKSGTVDRIKLNKDHALVIISPPPADKEAQYPHVLSDVVTSSTSMSISLPENVRNYLNLDNEITENQCVSMIWDSLYHMFTILQKEPEPFLKPSSMEGSTRAEDYIWGYSAKQVIDYKFHAERFYQLYCLRYTSANLTPYMMKFIDYCIYFMCDLGLPLCRFSTEGGEHSNYIHNSFYYQHTTRNGGKNGYDPNFAILFSTWKRLSHEICHGTDAAAAVDFKLWVKQHVAAKTIQRVFRRYSVRKRLLIYGWVDNPGTEHQQQINRQSLQQLQASVATKPGETGTETPKFLRGKSFILTGSVPKMGSKKMTQVSLTGLIVENGGKVKKTVPGNGKGRSTKKYIVLVNMKDKAKPTSAIKDAIRRGHKIVTYDFLYDCFEKKALQPFSSKYNVTALRHFEQRIHVEPTLHQLHFKKKLRMVSLLKTKKTRKANFSSTHVCTKVAKNVAVFYAHKKRRDDCKKGKYSFAGSSKLFVKYVKEFRTLSHSDQMQHYDMWMAQLAEQQRKTLLIKKLKLHNQTRSPNYLSVTTRFRGV